MARILVIDDEQSVRAAIEQALKIKDHEVIGAEDGTEALKQYSEESADLIITDMYMPGQDGIGVMVQFRKLAPQLPIIAMSGNPKGDVLMIAEKLGAIGVLEKPFEVKELLSLVERALKGGREL
jgi:DNA-binding NtrC family response regulator